MEKIKGFTSGFGTKRGGLRTPEAVDSLTKLKETGTEWLCLAFIVNQKRYSDTEIFFDYRETPTDKDLQFTIQKAHELGLKVCLKPVINSHDEVWRAEIDFPDLGSPGNDLYWDEWFSYYTAFMTHYAELADDNDCEMLCIGCEMLGTERKEKHWRALIDAVKQYYKGSLMYNTNHGKEGQVQWFDAVDIIGVSAYYRVASESNASEETMYQNWLKQKASLKAWSEKWQKPVLFAEVGVRSAAGCAAMPWDFLHRDLPYSEIEQANFYRSCLRAFVDEPWFAGFFWWHWSTRLYSPEKAKTNRGFDIYGKEAEAVIREWYAKEWK